MLTTKEPYVFFAVSKEADQMEHVFDDASLHIHSSVAFIGQSVLHISAGLFIRSVFLVRLLPLVTYIPLHEEI